MTAAVRMPGADSPFRDCYATGSHDIADATQRRPEIGWPIFRTGLGAGEPADGG